MSTETMQANANANDEESIAGKRLDLATADFLEAPMDIDPDKDQYGFPAPPDDGKYLCKLSYNEEIGLIGGECGPKSKTPGKRYAKLPISIEVLQGPFDSTGRLLPNAGGFDGAKFMDFPTTLSTQSGTNAIVGMVQAMGQPARAGMSARELLDLAQAALATEPTVYVTGRWEAWIKESETRLKGQKQFMPVIKDGQVVPGQYQHSYIDKDGNEVKAQFSVQRYDKVA